MFVFRFVNGGMLRFGGGSGMFRGFVVSFCK